MEMHGIIMQARRVIKNNAPAILTAIGVGGVVSTAYLSSKASVKAHKAIEADKEEHGTPVTKKAQMKAYAPIVWKYYVPVAISGAVSITCIIASQRVGNRRIAAAASAYALAERGFAEYKEKVLEQLGEKKEAGIREKVAQDVVSNNPPNGSNEVIALVGGDVLCCELMTRRYFKCDIETLKSAQNEINAEVNRNNYASVGEFYSKIGLPGTSVSDNMGWDSDKLLELRFSATMTEDGKPCIAFDYNYTRPLYGHS